MATLKAIRNSAAKLTSAKLLTILDKYTEMVASGDRRPAVAKKLRCLEDVACYRAQMPKHLGGLGDFRRANRAK